MTLIRVVDIETCGLAPPAGVCEIGWCDVVDDGHIMGPLDILTDPGQPIPPEASAIHHLTDEDMVDAPPWRDAVGDLITCTPWQYAAFAAHNAKFEQLWLTPEIAGPLSWICTYKCALRLWPDAPGHSNQVLRYWVKPEGLDRHIADKAHRAGPDAYVTAHLLREMLKLATVEQLIKWSGEPALLTKCNFGKHRGEKWTEIPIGFLHWVLGRDFDADVLHTVREEIARRNAK